MEVCCRVFVPGYKSSSLNKVSLKKYQKLDGTPKMFQRVCYAVHTYRISIIMPPPVGGRIKR